MKYTENIQNETGIRSIEIHSVGIIVLITTTSSDAIWATITSTTLSLSTYNLIERQMRFKSVRYRSAYSVIRQKKTERPITGSSVQNDLTKKIKITDLLTKGSFEENLVFWVYCCCYLISFKKCSTVCHRHLHLEKITNLTKRYFSKKYELEF